MDKPTRRVRPTLSRRRGCCSLTGGLSARRLNRSLNPCKASGRFLFQAALPDAYHPPTSTTQSRRYASVTCLIAEYLISPSIRVGLWLDVLATVVSVPKTTVNKNGELMPWPGEVRTTNRTFVSSPAPKPDLTEQFGKPLLRRLISGALHAGH